MPVKDLIRDLDSLKPLEIVRSALSLVRVALNKHDELTQRQANTVEELSSLRSQIFALQSALGDSGSVPRLLSELASASALLNSFSESESRHKLKKAGERLAFLEITSGKQLDAASIGNKAVHTAEEHMRSVIALSQRISKLTEDIGEGPASPEEGAEALSLFHALYRVRRTMQKEYHHCNTLALQFPAESQRAAEIYAGARKQVKETARELRPVMESAITAVVASLRERLVSRFTNFSSPVEASVEASTQWCSVLETMSSELTSLGGEVEDVESVISMVGFGDSEGLRAAVTAARQRLLDAQTRARTALEVAVDEHRQLQHVVAAEREIAELRSELYKSPWRSGKSMLLLFEKVKSRIAPSVSGNLLSVINLLPKFGSAKTQERVAALVKDADELYDFVTEMFFVLADSGCQDMERHESAMGTQDILLWYRARCELSRLLPPELSPLDFSPKNWHCGRIFLALLITLLRPDHTEAATAWEPAVVAVSEGIRGGKVGIKARKFVCKLAESCAARHGMNMRHLGDLAIVKADDVSGSPLVEDIAVTFFREYAACTQRHAAVSNTIDVMHGVQIASKLSREVRGALATLKSESPGVAECSHSEQRLHLITQLRGAERSGLVHDLGVLDECYAKVARTCFICKLSGFEPPVSLQKELYSVKQFLNTKIADTKKRLAMLSVSVAKETASKVEKRVNRTLVMNTSTRLAWARKAVEQECFEDARAVLDFSLSHTEDEELAALVREADEARSALPVVPEPVPQEDVPVEQDHIEALVVALEAAVVTAVLTRRVDDVRLEVQEACEKLGVTVSAEGKAQEALRSRPPAQELLEAPPLPPLKSLWAEEEVEVEPLALQKVICSAL